ncbi:hypothetical protein [Arsukibacterium sp.]|uniref:hypothetical protein n=1 Tax=Arsukibacterium sp. TaxID=1977258 RepID=UPI002FDAB0C5
MPEYAIQPTLRFFSVCAIPLLLSFSLPLKAALGWHGPEPFRLAQFDEREFDFNLESFLQRLSFSPSPLQSFTPLWQQDGWYGSGGSTRSREFYVHSMFQKKIAFDMPGFAGVRVSRNEDLDGRYDRQLIGAGYYSEKTDTEYSLWGDVTGAKDQLELQFELKQYFANGSWLSSALILTDAFYNSKTYTDNRYETAPVTWYLAGGWQLAQHQFYGFSNINFNTEFVVAESEQRLRAKQYSAGLGWNWQLNSALQFTLQGHGRYSQRLQQNLLHNADDSTRQRHYFELTAQWQHFAHGATGANGASGDSQAQFWYGLHALSLNERDSRFAMGAEHSAYRRELYAFAGMHWQFTNRLSLGPVLYLGYAKARHELPVFSDTALNDSGLLAKISPNLTLLLSEKTGARLVLNPSIKLHQLQFGGGNVQLHIPF